MFFIFFAAIALAEDPEDFDQKDRKVIYNQRTEIDFEEVQVDGQLVKPEGTLLIDRARAKFNPLIRLREDWDKEISESIEEVE